MRALLHHRSSRTLTAIFILTAQVHLLWVAVLHRHEAMTLRGGVATLREGGAQPQPAIESGLFCTACQIVRQGAARPTPGAPPAQPAAPNRSLALIFSLRFHSHQPTALYGRAPPLS